MTVVLWQSGSCGCGCKTGTFYVARVTMSLFRYVVSLTCNTYNDDGDDNGGDDNNDNINNNKQSYSFYLDF